MRLKRITYVHLSIMCCYLDVACKNVVAVTVFVEVPISLLQFHIERLQT